MRRCRHGISATALVAAGLCACALLTSCSGATPASPQPVVSTAASSPTSSATGSGPSPTGSGAPTPTPSVSATKLVAVIRIQDGPASPISPDTDSYYYRLERHACTDLSHSGSKESEPALFTALGSICLAIAHPGRHVDWKEAQKAYDAATRDLSGCLMDSARATLKRALMAHQRDPSAPPTFGVPSQDSACAPTITGVALVTDPSSSKVSVLIIGEHLFEVTKVRIGGVSRSARSPDHPNWEDGRDCGQVTVPNAPDLKVGSTVKIRVTGAGYTVSRHWTVQPVLPADQVAPDVNVFCALSLSTSSPSP